MDLTPGPEAAAAERERVYELAKPAIERWRQTSNRYAYVESFMYSAAYVAYRAGREDEAAKDQERSDEDACRAALPAEGLIQCPANPRGHHCIATVGGHLEHPCVCGATFTLPGDQRLREKIRNEGREDAARDIQALCDCEDSQDSEIWRQCEYRHAAMVARLAKGEVNQPRTPLAGVSGDTESSPEWTGRGIDPSTIPQWEREVIERTFREQEERESSPEVER